MFLRHHPCPMIPFNKLSLYQLLQFAWQEEAMKVKIIGADTILHLPGKIVGSNLYIISFSDSFSCSEFRY